MVMPVKFAGYFRELGRVLPTGQEPSLVDSRGGLAVEYRAPAAAYLRTAAVFGAGSGFVDDWFTGAKNVAPRHTLTDGAWIWFADLPYYVEHYGVALPEELLQHMQAQGWRCPVLSQEALVALADKVFKAVKDMQKKGKR